VHEASLFVVSKLGLEDQENNYGVKVAVKLFNKPFSGSTRESEIVRKIGKQKGFIKYKGYIHTPDRRLGTTHSPACSASLYVRVESVALQLSSTACLNLS
jgi:hypothetical protein